MSAVGCGGAQPSEELSSYEASLEWTPCADEGEHCSFSGTQAVRYGAHDEFVVKTAEDGMHCAAEAFGTVSLPDGHCEVSEDAAAAVETDDTAEPAAAAASNTESEHAHEHERAAADAPESAEHEHERAAADAPEPAEHEHAETSETEAGAGAGAGAAAGSSDHAAHAGAAGAMAGAPKLDLSSLPSGEPGSDRVELGTTSEKPVRNDGVGAFRTVCDFSHMNYDDPIVFPGQPGKAHLHAFFGNASADAMSTVESIRDTGRSTCRGGIANRTAYWVPAVIDANGKPVKPKSLDTYYKSGYNGVEPGEVQPFPSGLRMIAGDQKSSSTQTRAYWGCRENFIGHPGSIPNECPGGDSIVMMVEFPQCWDGKNLDSADHKSHMAYPTQGGCPDTHPVPIPAITMNVLYDVPAGGTKGWRLASDMYDASKPGGFSAHADWFEGWDPEIVESFVENCIKPGVDCHSHLLGDGRTIR